MKLNIQIPAKAGIKEETGLIYLTTPDRTTGFLEFKENNLDINIELFI
jgi:hypothetical protein